ncbi:MAG TPA: HAD family phosphatase [Erysipelotrichaceae bacterium]|mgnify:FL=1|nr:HAD family phosphatase [Erysipelotrichaceae bacterium]
MAVIFDFNGTIIFDKAIIDQSWQQFFYNHTDIRYTPEQLKPYIHGFNPDVTIRFFLKDKFDQQMMQQLIDEKETIYRELCKKNENNIYKLADGIEQFLDELKKREIPCTIATAAPSTNVDFFFQSLKLDRWFKRDDVVGSDHTFPGKPNPEIYLRAAGKLNTAIQDCVIFEDAESGIQAAINANARTVVGVSSLLSRQQLLDLGSDIVIDNYKELDLLLKIVL